MKNLVNFVVYLLSICSSGLSFFVGHQMMRIRPVSFLAKSIRLFSRPADVSSTPLSFVLPSNLDLWPKSYPNASIGEYVDHMKTFHPNVSVFHSFSQHELDRFRSEGYTVRNITGTQEKLLIGFELFKEKFGHCDVRSTFMIPFDRPDHWPPACGGLRIGLRHVEMRDNNAHKKIHSKMAALGYNMSPFVPFETLRTALITFRKIYGEHTQVPSDFITPSNNSPDDKVKTVLWPEETRGLRLGYIIYNIQVKGTYPQYRDELAALGVNYDIQGGAISYGLVKEAYLAFQAIHGDTLEVPHNYIIPSNTIAYPRSTWGLRLGDKLKGRSRWPQHRIDEFAALGLEPVEEKIGWEETYAAFKVYKQLHGDLKVKKKYVIPRNDESYAEAVRGLGLGTVLFNIRVHNAYAEHRDELLALGIDMEIRPADERMEFLYETFVAYKKLHNHLVVPQDYIVPEHPAFRTAAWGMELGKEVVHIHNGESPAYIELRNRLVQHGILFEVIKTALLAYKAQYNSLLVPFGYIVPHNDTNYPRHTWGLKLGDCVKHIRVRGSYTAHHKELREMGFYFGRMLDLQFKAVYKAVIAYRAIHGDVLIPRNFVVPREDSRYPREAWGFNLGHIVASIRYANSYMNYRPEWEALGIQIRQRRQGDYFNNRSKNSSSGDNREEDEENDWGLFDVKGLKI